MVMVRRGREVMIARKECWCWTVHGEKNCAASALHNFGFGKKLLDRYYIRVEILSKKCLIEMTAVTCRAGSEESVLSALFLLLELPRR